MNTSNHQEPLQEPGASSGRANDKYEGGEAESKATDRHASQPGDADNAAGMDNPDKGDGANGSNTNKY